MDVTIVSATGAKGGRVACVINYTDSDGERHENVRYIYDKDDPHGLSPDVGAALTKWRTAGNKVAPYVVPDVVVPVPRVISRRQLLLGLVASKQITDEEGIAAATTGAVPAALSPVVASLEPADQTAFLITWASMVEVERSHPLIATIIAANGMTDAQVDDFFRLCGGL